MDINYYRQYEPIFGAWHITRLIGEGSFGKVFEMEREDFGEVYKAALKAITIPASQSEVRSVRSEGMDEESVRATFESKVQELVKEFVLMSKLKGNSNVVSYENHQVIEHKDNIGWDILIQMELLTPLDEYIQQKKALSRQEIIKLGIDLCKALELCQKHNIIHRDIKPENTFISENGDFKLGDFGVARTIEKTTGGLSKQGSYPYMAPEVYNGKPYGTTVDIYSLGLILYRLLNGNRLPFLPAAPAPITYADRENAMAKRFNGAPLPMPSHADGRLGEIVLKACAFEPKERYSSPGQMRQELEAILYNKEEGKYIYPDGDQVPQASIHSVKNEDQPPIRRVEGGTISDFGDRVSDFGKTVSDFGGTAGDFKESVGNADRHPAYKAAALSDKGKPYGLAANVLDVGLLALLAVCLMFGIRSDWILVDGSYLYSNIGFMVIFFLAHAVLIGASMAVILSPRKRVVIAGLAVTVAVALIGLTNGLILYSQFPVRCILLYIVLAAAALLAEKVDNRPRRRNMELLFYAVPVFLFYYWYRNSYPPITVRLTVCSVIYCGVWLAAARLAAKISDKQSRIFLYAGAGIVTALLIVYQFSLTGFYMGCLFSVCGGVVAIGGAACAGLFLLARKRAARPPV